LISDLRPETSDPRPETLPDPPPPLDQRREAGLEERYHSVVIYSRREKVSLNYGAPRQALRRLEMSFVKKYETLILEMWKDTREDEIGGACAREISVKVSLDRKRAFVLYFLHHKSVDTLEIFFIDNPNRLRGYWGAQPTQWLDYLAIDNASELLIEPLEEVSIRL
jgi:hypothetical protein